MAIPIGVMDIQPYLIQMFRIIPGSSWVELNQVGYGYYPNPTYKKKKKKKFSHRHSHSPIRNHNNNNNHNNYSNERFNGRDFLLKWSYSFGFERNLASERMVMEPATTSPWRYRRGNHANEKIRRLRQRRRRRIIKNEITLLHLGQTC